MNDIENTSLQISHWQGAVKAHWDVDASLTRLDGEYDLNFLAKADNGDGYILKVMRPGCDTWLVDMQVKAFEHIAAHQPGLPCPRVLRAKNAASLLKLVD